MGVDAAGGQKHSVLGLQTNKTKLLKQLFRSGIGAVPSCEEERTEPGIKVSSTVPKGEKVHIFVGAGVVAIHKPGFGCYGNLVKKCAGGAGGTKIGCLIAKVV